MISSLVKGMEHPTLSSKNREVFNSLHDQFSEWDVWDTSTFPPTRIESGRGKSEYKKFPPETEIAPHIPTGPEILQRFFDREITDEEYRRLAKAARASA